VVRRDVGRGPVEPGGGRPSVRDAHRFEQVEGVGTARVAEQVQLHQALQAAEHS
jgi:hypothetical protein